MRTVVARTLLSRAFIVQDCLSHFFVLTSDCLLSDFSYLLLCSSSFARLFFIFPPSSFGFALFSVIHSSRSEKLNRKFLTSSSLVLNEAPDVLGRGLLSSAIASIICFQIESFLIFSFSFTSSLNPRCVFSLFFL